MLIRKFNSRFFGILIFALVILFLIPCWVSAQEEIMPQTARGKILEIKEIDIQQPQTGYEDSDYNITYYDVMIKILSGEHRGEIITAQHVDDERMVYRLDIDEGDEVLVYVELNDQGEIQNAYIAEIYRQKHLLYLLLIFLLSLAVFGGIKGIKTIVSLAVTGLAVFSLLLPGLLAGFNPILLTVGICAGVTAITIFIISGFSRKAVAAIIGTTGGVAAAGIIAYIIGTASKLTGLGEQEAQMLMFIPQGTGFDFKGLLFAGIIIGALGAVMDVGMSIASAMHEIKEVKPDIQTKDLIKAGMNVGRDIMGTMSNTLILAYAGASLPLLLLFLANDIPFQDYINWDTISSEVVRALAGSIGLILTIPLTVVVSAAMGKYFK